MSAAVSPTIFNNRGTDGPQRGRSKACRERHAIGLERERNPDWLTARNAAISAAAENHRCQECGAVCPPKERACSLHVVKDVEFQVCDLLAKSKWGDVKPQRKIPSEVIEAARRKVMERAGEPSMRPSWRDWVLGKVPQISVAR